MCPQYRLRKGALESRKCRVLLYIGPSAIHPLVLLGSPSALSFPSWMQDSLECLHLWEPVGAGFESWSRNGEPGLRPDQRLSLGWEPCPLALPRPDRTRIREGLGDSVEGARAGRVEEVQDQSSKD